MPGPVVGTAVRSAARRSRASRAEHPEVRHDESGSRADVHFALDRKASWPHKVAVRTRLRPENPRQRGGRFR